MKNNILIISLLVIGLLAVAGYSYFSRSTSKIAGKEEVVATTPIESGKKYTLADIANHGTSNDCWLVIEGRVYDVTKYIADKKHPGGAALLEGCGKDATSLFNTRPMGSGTPHSDKARSFLPNFYIGQIE